jgi:putative alpha-1,2-mannosidase
MSAEMRKTDDVDPFIGTEAVDLPKPEGIAGTWFYLKAQIGNCHPGASLPFSPVTAAPYSGAYPTGYGVYDINTHGAPPKLYREKRAYGISHVHHSGTGYTGYFYNYLLVVPFVAEETARHGTGRPGEHAGSRDGGIIRRAPMPSVDYAGLPPQRIDNEQAEPGYYAGRFVDEKIDFDLTVGHHSAAHRYRFPEAKSAGRFADRTVAGHPGSEVTSWENDPPSAVGVVAADVTAAGLSPKRAQARPTAVSLSIDTLGNVVGEFEIYGVRWFFAVRCPGWQAQLWRSRPSVTETELLRLSERTLSLSQAECRQTRAGVMFTAPAEGGSSPDEQTTEGDPAAPGHCIADLYLGLSLDSREAAERYAEEAAESGFEALRLQAAERWERHLERVEVGAAGDVETTKFYTALYHSLQKPVACEGSNFLWRDGPPLYCDMATLWDQYKTQLPLMFALCSEHARPVAQSLLAVSTSIRAFPAGILLARDFERFSNQSRLLAAVVIKDAFDLTLAAAGGDLSGGAATGTHEAGDAPPGAGGDCTPGAAEDHQAAGSSTTTTGETRLWEEAVHALADALPKAAEAVEPGRATNGYSHLVDIAYAASCTAEMARQLGLSEAAARSAEYCDLWREAFDPATGLMRRGDYYEAAALHYSFRIFHAMDARIALAGGAETFCRLLDRFFGFDAAPVEQLSDPPWESAREAGMALGRFDGLNNEVMLETPFAYHYVGRPDRTAEVVAAIRAYHFSDTPGGIPGNDDSGALSSWYVWTSVGLFPVAGSAIFLLCPPAFPEVQLQVGENVFWIRTNQAEDSIAHMSDSEFPSNAAEQLGAGSREGDSAGLAAQGPVGSADRASRYIARVRLNGVNLDRSYLTYAEVIAGGTLEVTIGEKPETFRPSTLPPCASSE